jgi:hypothetical protein
VYTVTGVVSRDDDDSVSQSQCCEVFNDVYTDDMILLSFPFCHGECYNESSTGDVPEEVYHHLIECPDFNSGNGYTPLATGVGISTWPCDIPIPTDFNAAIVIARGGGLGQPFNGYSAFGFWPNSAAETNVLLGQFLSGQEIEMPFQLQRQLAGSGPFCYWNPEVSLRIQLVSGEQCLSPGDPGYPDPQNCDELDECDTFGDQKLSIRSFENCSFTNDFGLEVAQLWESLNDTGAMPNVFALQPSDLVADPLFCILASKYNFWSEFGDVRSADTEVRRLNPGKPWQTITQAGESQEQYYVFAIAVETFCDPDYVDTVYDGSANYRWFNNKIHFIFHGWLMQWDGTDYTIPLGYYTPVCDSYTYVPSIIGGEPRDCKLRRFMYSNYEYDKCGITKKFEVYITPPVTLPPDP